MRLFLSACSGGTDQAPHASMNGSESARQDQHYIHTVPVPVLVLAKDEMHMATIHAAASTRRRGRVLNE
jgi:hypothetical protein